MKESGPNWAQMRQASQVMEEKNKKREEKRGNA
jgi:hypothetical protein